MKITITELMFITFQVLEFLRSLPYTTGRNIPVVHSTTNSHLNTLSTITQSDSTDRHVTNITVTNIGLPNVSTAVPVPLNVNTITSVTSGVNVKLQDNGSKAIVTNKQLKKQRKHNANLTTNDSPVFRFHLHERPIPTKKYKDERFNNVSKGMSSENAIKTGADAKYRQRRKHKRIVRMKQTLDSDYVSITNPFIKVIELSADRSLVKLPVLSKIPDGTNRNYIKGSLGRVASRPMVDSKSNPPQSNNNTFVNKLSKTNENVNIGVGKHNASESIVLNRKRENIVVTTVVYDKETIKQVPVKQNGDAEGKLLQTVIAKTQLRSDGPQMNMTTIKSLEKVVLKATVGTIMSEIKLKRTHTSPKTNTNNKSTQDKEAQTNIPITQTAHDVFENKNVEKGDLNKASLTKSKIINQHMNSNNSHVSHTTVSPTIADPGKHSGKQLKQNLRDHNSTLKPDVPKTHEAIVKIQELSKNGKDKESEETLSHEVGTAIAEETLSHEVGTAIAEETLSHEVGTAMHSKAKMETQQFKIKTVTKRHQKRNSRNFGAICKKLKKKGLPMPPSCSDRKFDTWT